MDTRPLFPTPLSVPFLLSVIGCFGFWLAAYVLIIRRGIKDKSFGMPIASMCWNIGWEAMFSFFYKSEFRLIEYGNSAWVLLDLGVLYAAWMYAPDDFKNPVAKRWVRPAMLLGIGLAMLVMKPFIDIYRDPNGTFLGWADAFAMSMLFIAMLLRRDSVQGQSIWIAITMFLGNVAAYFWVELYPPGPQLDHRMNLCFAVTTGIFNVIYIVLVWQKCREQGINPWTRA